jgi:site-specific recombinase XerD
MTDNNPQSAAQAFQNWLDEQGKHLNTIRSYANDIKQFYSWCRSTFGTDFQLSDVARSDIQDYRGFLVTRNASPASVNRRITALRQFFEFCVRETAVSENPVADVGGVAADPRPPAFLLRKDALLLVRTAERQPSALDPTVILLLVHAGMRSSELCALTVGNVHLTPREGRLFVKGQRGKATRFVFLSTRAQNALRNYMRWRGISVLARRMRAEPLFLGYEGTPLTQQAVDQIVKRIGRLIGMPDITPSMLRNTYAAQQLQSGLSAEMVALNMGVASLRTIQRLKEHLAGQRDVE